MSPLLEHWLNRYYQARVLNRGRLPEVKKTLRERFAADQTLMAEAKARLEEITEDLTKQCFIAKIQREALIDATRN